MSDADWPAPEPAPAREPERRPAPLPRVEDLAVSEQGYDREQVREAFDAFYRHAAQLDATLRTLEAVDVFQRTAAELRAELRTMRGGGWTIQSWQAGGGGGRGVSEWSLPPAFPRVAAEALFLIVIGVIVGIAGWSKLTIVLVMGLALAVVWLIEWVAARERAIPRATAAVAAPSLDEPVAEDDAAAPPEAWPHEEGPDAMTIIGTPAPAAGAHDAAEVEVDGGAEEAAPEEQLATEAEPVSQDTAEEPLPATEPEPVPVLEAVPAPEPEPEPESAADDADADGGEEAVAEAAPVEEPGHEPPVEEPGGEPAVEKSIAGAAPPERETEEPEHTDAAALGIDEPALAAVAEELEPAPVVEEAPVVEAAPERRRFRLFRRRDDEPVISVQLVADSTEPVEAEPEPEPEDELAAALEAAVREDQPERAAAALDVEPRAVGLGTDVDDDVAGEADEPSVDEVEGSDEPADAPAADAPAADAGEPAIESPAPRRFSWFRHREQAEPHPIAEFEPELAAEPEPEPQPEPQLELEASAVADELAADQVDEPEPDPDAEVEAAPPEAPDLPVDVLAEQAAQALERSRARRRRAPRRARRR